MSATVDPAVLSAAEIAAALHELEQQERALSRRRRLLHDRLDFVRGGGGGQSPAANEQIVVLEGQEKALSEQRRDVQSRIDALQTERERRRQSVYPKSPGSRRSGQPSFPGRRVLSGDDRYGVTRQEVP